MPLPGLPRSLGQRGGHSGGRNARIGAWGFATSTITIFNRYSTLWVLYSANWRLPLATRCLYCGQSSGWGRLKRLLDDQFCNSAHREAYNERLRKIVIDLSKYQRHSAEGARADSDPAITHLAMQLGRDPRLMGDPVSVVPTIASPASSHPRMQSVMCLPEIAVAQTDCGFVGMAAPSLAPMSHLAPLMVPRDANAVPTIATALPYKSQTLATPRLSGNCAPSLRIGPAALNPVWPAGAKPAPRSRSLPLPVTFENTAQIERWRLRIRFQRFDYPPVYKCLQAS
jgi:hypothetical protein